MGEPLAPLPSLLASLARSLPAATLRRPVAAAASVGRLILLAAVVGVIAMHQLAGMPASNHHHDTAPPAHAVLAAPDHCPHPPGGDCPDRVHGHPGQVCQPHQGGNGPDGIPALVPLPSTPTESPLLTARTAARESGGGTGCGPPRLAELSLRRI